MRLPAHPSTLQRIQVQCSCATCVQALEKGQYSGTVCTVQSHVYALPILLIFPSAGSKPCACSGLACILGVRLLTV